jgi:hypothetical protein
MRITAAQALLLGAFLGLPFQALGAPCRSIQLLSTLYVQPLTISRLGRKMLAKGIDHTEASHSKASHPKADHPKPIIPKPPPLKPEPNGPVCKRADGCAFDDPAIEATRVKGEQSMKDLLAVQNEHRVDVKTDSVEKNYRFKPEKLNGRSEASWKRIFHASNLRIIWKANQCGGN